MNTYPKNIPYLTELKEVFVSTIVRQSYAEKHLKKYWEETKDRFSPKRWYAIRYDIHDKWEISSVFGSFKKNFYNFQTKSTPRFISEKCGIEILGATNTKKNNWRFEHENKKFISVDDLKKACKANNIYFKSNSKKHELLALLQKL